MSLSNAFETSILQHILQNAAIPNLGDATGLPGSAAPGNVFVSLHTADPGEAGTQSTNEATYTGYARKAVARSSAAWAVSGNTASNLAAITYDPCSAGSNTISHWGIGYALSGANVLILSGPVGPQGSPTTLAVSPGITPQFDIGTLQVTAD